MQKKKIHYLVSCWKDFILRSSIQDSPLFSPAIFVLKLPLKSSESLGLSKTWEAERLLGKLAQTHSRMAWLRGHGLFSFCPDCAWALSQERVPEHFFSTCAQYVIRLFILLLKQSHSCTDTVVQVLLLKRQFYFQVSRILAKIVWCGSSQNTTL